MTITSALANYEDASRPPRSLWLASDSVDRREFSTFARSLDLKDRYPGLQAIGWRSVVTDAEKAEFVAATRADGEPSFTVTPPGRRPSTTSPWTATRGSPPAATRPRLPATWSCRRRAGRWRSSCSCPCTTSSWPRTPPSQSGAGGSSAGRSGRAAWWPASRPGFRARGPFVREETFEFGGRTFALRYAPLPGNALLTERTIPAPLVLVMGVAGSILLGALYREVDRLARIDSLTGVANRRSWDEELPRELVRAARSGRPLCLAMLDLDHFKAYNDRHGHQAGDRLLKATAAASRLP